LARRSTARRQYCVKRESPAAGHGGGYQLASDLTGVAQLLITLNVPNQLVYSAHDYSWYHDGLSSYILS
jgi:hypothetical protein